MCLRIEIFYSETRAAKVCLPFVGHLMRNRKDMNRISFLNRGYAFKGLLAVNTYNGIYPVLLDIFFRTIFGPGISPPPPHKNQMVAPL